MIRLDKFLSEMGVGTRSEVKKILKARQVTVNDAVVIKPETKVDPESDIVCYKDRRICYQKYESRPIKQDERSLLRKSKSLQLFWFL